jgi:hypothetical protein
MDPTSEALLMNQTTAPIITGVNPPEAQDEIDLGSIVLRKRIFDSTFGKPGK